LKNHLNLNIENPKDQLGGILSLSYSWYPLTFPETTMKVANSMASKSRIALKGIKSLIQNGIDRDVEVGCIMESDVFALCMSGNDAREGITAFLEKRSPNFQDKL